MKQKLVSSIRRMGGEPPGGELLDWAFSNGDFVGLGVNDAGSFLLVRIGERGGKVAPLGAFSPANGEIITGMGEPNPFCFTNKEVARPLVAADSLVRLALAWRCVAVVVCGENGEQTPFFIFPEQKVHQWFWDKPWAIDHAGNSRNPLCNIWWEPRNPESGSSRVTIPVMDPEDPNRIVQLATFDLRTGRFLIRGKQIYPESLQGERHDEMSRSIRPSTGEDSSASARQRSDDGKHEGKQQIERPDGD